MKNTYSTNVVYIFDKRRIHIRQTSYSQEADVVVGFQGYRSKDSLLTKNIHSVSLADFLRTLVVKATCGNRSFEINDCF